ncbi:MAG: hypothetical protein AAF696_36115 [Bacteroidota bacterium]
MLLSLEKDIKLPFAPDLGISHSGDSFFCASSFGKILILDSHLEILNELNLHRRLRSLDFSSNYKAIISTDLDSLNIYDLRGELLHRIPGAFEQARIYQHHLWTLKKHSPGRKTLEVFRMGNWESLDKVEFDDPFENSRLKISQLDSWNKDAIFLELKKGLDKPKLLIWEISGKKLRRKHQLADMNFPEALNPSGNRYLYREIDHLSVYNSLSHQKVYGFNYPLEVGRVFHAVFLSENRIMLQTERGAYVFDLFSKKIIDELKIKLPQTQGMGKLFSSFSKAVTRLNQWLFIEPEESQIKKTLTYSLFAIDLAKHEIEGRQLNLFM